MEKQFPFIVSDISGVLWRKSICLLQALQFDHDDPVVEMKYK